MEEVGNAATRLESSFESRRATIRNLAVLRSIEDQAHEVSDISDNFNQFSSEEIQIIGSIGSICLLVSKVRICVCSSNEDIYFFFFF